MVVLFKRIKPNRFKEEAVNRALRNALRRVGAGMKKDFEATVKTWEKPAVFRVATHLTAGIPSPSVEVWTDNALWKMLDEGTKPHDIWAGIYTGRSDKKALAFPSVFAAKTKVGVLDSFAGSSGGEKIVRPYVQHPGTKARKWSQALEKKWKKRFKEEMEKGLHEARRDSGHAA
jgi:hypothetical protein